MRVYVQTIMYTLALEVEATGTVQNVKEKFTQERKTVEPYQQRLFFNNRELRNHEKLSDIPVVADSILTFRMSRVGG